MLQTSSGNRLKKRAGKSETFPRATKIWALAGISWQEAYLGSFELYEEILVPRAGRLPDSYSGFALFLDAAAGGRYR